jgi:hypothetical protein
MSNRTKKEKRAEPGFLGGIGNFQNKNKTYFRMIVIKFL